MLGVSPCQLLRSVIHRHSLSCSHKQHIMFYKDVATKSPASEKKILSEAHPHPRVSWILKRLWLSPEGLNFSHLSPFSAHQVSKLNLQRGKRSCQHYLTEKLPLLTSCASSLPLCAVSGPSHVPIYGRNWGLPAPHWPTPDSAHVLARYPSLKEFDVRWEISQLIQIFSDREEDFQSPPSPLY